MLVKFNERSALILDEIVVSRWNAIFKSVRMLRPPTPPAINKFRSEPHSAQTWELKSVRHAINHGRHINVG